MVYFSVDEVSDHFERQPIVEQQPAKTSALSKQLESSVDFSNCFMEYAKYDGRVRFRALLILSSFMLGGGGGVGWDKKYYSILL